MYIMLHHTRQSVDQNQKLKKYVQLNRDMNNIIFHYPIALKKSYWKGLSENIYLRRKPLLIIQIGSLKSKKELQLKSEDSV